MKEPAPVGVYRIEKAVHRVFTQLCRFACIERTEQILASKDQGEDEPHDHYRRIAVLFRYVALLKQRVYALIDKERINLVLT